MHGAHGDAGMDRALNEAPPRGLYPQLLGPLFATLSPAVQALHAGSGVRRYHGEAEAVRGRGALATLCAWAARLPPTSRGTIDVEIDTSDGGETWTRRFGVHAMRSRLWAQAGLLREHLGLLRFGFRLGVDGGAVTWRVERVDALGIRLPTRWFGGVHARESEVDGRYRFEVSAALPVVGLVVAHRGWLHVE